MIGKRIASFVHVSVHAICDAVDALVARPVPVPVRITADATRRASPNQFSPRRHER